MPPSLGVDHTSEALVVTPPLPAAVLGNAAALQQTKAKRLWKQQVADGTISEHVKPPTAPSAWQAFLVPSMVVGAVTLGLAVLNWVTYSFSRLVGFQPEHPGLWPALAAGCIAATCLWMWESSTRARDYSLVACRQRRLRDREQWSQLRIAHQAAQQTFELWPELPFEETTDTITARLRTALWELSETLASRAKYSEMLRDLRVAAVGLPTHTTAAHRVSSQISQAEASYRADEAEARRRLDQLTCLAQRCQALHDEQAAIRRAKTVSQQAFAVLGPAPAPTIDAAEEQVARAAQLTAIRDAYAALPAAIQLPTPPGIRFSTSLLHLHREPGVLPEPTTIAS